MGSNNSKVTKVLLLWNSNSSHVESNSMRESMSQLNILKILKLVHALYQGFFGCIMHLI